MADFETCIKYVLKNNTVKTDNNLIDDINQDEEYYNYKTYYWDCFQLDSIKSNKKALMIFDMSLDCGNKITTTIVQKTLYVIGYKIKSDGIYRTAITNSFLDDCDTDMFLDTFQKKRKEYYDSLIKENEKYSFLKTEWYNRADRCYDYAKSLEEE